MMQLSTNLKKRLISFLVGLLLFAFGVVSFLRSLKYFINLPEFLFNPVLLEVLIAIGGIFLLFDSFSIGHGKTKFLAVVIGLLLATLGLIPILIKLDLLGFLPFIATLKIKPIILEAILVFYGAYLIVDTFAINKYTQEVANY